MKSGTFTKLMFTGIASGIVFSCAVVLIASISSIPQSEPDVTRPPEAADSRADREVVPRTSDQVVRREKSDALDITIAILKGDDILPDDPVVSFDPRETASITPTDETGAVAEETEQPAADATVAVEPVAESPGETKAQNDDAREQAITRTETEAAPAPARVPAPAPQRVTERPQRVTERTATGDPLNIIPTPKPVENRPAATPTTTQNFTTEAPAAPDNSIANSR